MGYYKDLTGRRFGKLVVLERAGSKWRNAAWLCQCNCGNQSVTTTSALVGGTTRSCGCLIRETSHKKPNKYRECDGYMVGTDGKGNEFIFDKDDYGKVEGYCWRKQRAGHFTTTVYNPVKNKTLALHRLIMNVPDCAVDHINRNPADNRKENLRLATKKQNGRNRSLHSNNTSGYSGVSYDKGVQKWKAYIIVNGERVHLGAYDLKEDAVKARKNAEIKYYGEFAPQANVEIKCRNEIARDPNVTIPPKKPQKKWTNEENETLSRLMTEGLTYREIGERMNRTRDSIGQRIMRLKQRKYSYA